MRRERENGFGRLRRPSFDAPISEVLASPSHELPPGTGGGGEGVWALGDSKRPGAEPLRFTTQELDAAGSDPARFGLNV